MAIMQPDYNQNQDPSVAPTLGTYGGLVTGQRTGQGKGTISGRGSGYTNLQSYIRANESNPNAQLIQQRTGQATTGQAEAQKGFETQRQMAQTGLEGIQSQAGLVQSALENPTEFVKSQPNIERITALRTGQERIGNPTELLANVQQSQAGLQSQRGQLAGSLQRDITGTGLQEYLRSQRSNPALATAGENRLDRFLAEQTPSGQSAIQAGQTEAQRIQGLETPDITDITTLTEQLKQNPLTTQAGISNRLLEAARPEQANLENINKQYVASQIGVNPEDAKYISDQVQNYRNQQSDLIGQKQSHEKEINNLVNAINNENMVLENPNTSVTDKSRARENIRNFEKQKQQREDALNKTNFSIDAGQRWYNDYIGRNQNTIDLYNRYLNEIQQTRENILGQYDPNRLARVRALGQISGFDFNPYLQRGL